MRPSRKLSPEARRIAASHDAHAVEGIAEITQNANVSRLTHDLEVLGAHVFTPARNPTYIRFEIPANHLEEVANVRDVLYVEAEDAIFGVTS
jgi:hypothetical protein